MVHWHLLSLQFRETIFQIEVFAVFCKSARNAVLGFVVFSCADEVLSSDDSSFDWLPYSWDTVEVSNVPGSVRVSNKRTIGGANQFVDEYEKVRVVIHAWSSLVPVVAARGQFVEWCAEVHGQDHDGGGKDPDDFDGIPTRFQSQFDAIVAFQTNIAETVSPSLGDIFSSVPGQSEAVAGLLRECEDAKYAAQGCASLIEQERMSSPNLSLP